MSAYLVRRSGGVYHMRRRVPAELTRRFGCAEITTSLRVRTRTIAMRRLWPLLRVVEEVFELARRNPDLEADRIRAIARDWFRRALAEQENQVVHYVPTDEACFREHINEANHRHALQKMMIVVGDVAGTARQEAGIIDPDLSPEERQALDAYVARGLAELHRLRAAQLKGDFSGKPEDLLFANLGEPAAHALPSKNLPARPTIPALSASERFLAVFEAYLSEKEMGQETRKGTTSDYGKNAKLFAAIVGDKPVNEYTSATIRQFKETMLKLPAKRNKSSKDRSLGAADWVRRAEKTGEPTITPETFNKALTPINQAFEWAIANGHRAKELGNPCDGIRITIRRDRRPRDLTNAWAVPQMKELFEQSPLYRGCHSVARCSRPGTLIPKDAARFWVPLVMAFTGARLEEICQLRVSDVKEREGVAYFDLQDGEDQSLKSKAARRLVPVHSTLVRCGLMTFIGKQRQAKVEWLFGDLVPQGPDRKRGGSLSKWFPLYRREALKGCPTSRLEDFRATFKTRLLNDGAPRSLVDEVVGHEQQGMDAHYYKGAEHIGQLRDVVERCRYDGLDLSHLFET